MLLFWFLIRYIMCCHYYFLQLRQVLWASVQSIFLRCLCCKYTCHWYLWNIDWSRHISLQKKIHFNKTRVLVAGKKGGLMRQGGWQGRRAYQWTDVSAWTDNIFSCSHYQNQHTQQDNQSIKYDVYETCSRKLGLRHLLNCIFFIKGLLTCAISQYKFEVKSQPPSWGMRLCSHAVYPPLKFPLAVHEQRCAWPWTGLDTIMPIP